MHTQILWHFYDFCCGLLQQIFCYLSVGITRHHPYKYYPRTFNLGSITKTTGKPDVTLALPQVCCSSDVSFDSGFATSPKQTRDKWMSDSCTLQEIGDKKQSGFLSFACVYTVGNLLANTKCVKLHALEQSRAKVLVLAFAKLLRHLGECHRSISKFKEHLRNFALLRVCRLKVTVLFASCHFIRLIFSFMLVGLYILPYHRSLLSIFYKEQFRTNKTTQNRSWFSLVFLGYILKWRLERTTLGRSSSNNTNDKIFNHDIMWRTDLYEVPEIASTHDHP